MFGQPIGEVNEYPLVSHYVCLFLMDVNGCFVMSDAFKLHMIHLPFWDKMWKNNYKHI